MLRFTCQDIQKEFIRKYQEKEFVTDKTGCKTVEIINASFLVDRDWLIRKPNYDYFNAELEWYSRGVPNINDLYKGEKPPPKAWIASADKHGNINSNYGYLIWSEKYRNQYENCFQELKKNPDSRRAVMIYTRPDIWVEYNENGKSDFICTFANQFFIRNGKLDSLYILRSNDSTFGYCNDVLWAMHVQKLLANDLQVPIGNLYWAAGSLHVYERDFKYLENPIIE